MSLGLADALFRPRTVALIGASGDAAKSTSRPHRYLRRFGFEGRVVPINPTRAEVLGERAFPTLREAPGPIDHAFIMVPAAAVPDAVDQCCEAGVSVATIFSDGFADAGEAGLARQRALVARARHAGLRLLGPNSMGLLDTGSRLALTVSAVFDGLELERGPAGFVSQSGSIMGALLTRAQPRGLGFSQLVSMGNEADLTIGDIVDAMIDDDRTRVILLFLETLRDAPRLAAAARRAHAAGKPVVALRLGRSEAGRDLAASHTGALAGTQATVSAFFRAHGIVEVEYFESLFEIAPLLVGRSPPKGRRVAVVTPTGGGAATVVDRLGRHEVEFVRAPDALKAELAQFGLRAGTGPAIDLTVAGVRADVLEAATRAVAHPEICDALLVVAGSSSRFFPEVAVRPILPLASGEVPVAVFVVPEAPETLRMLGTNGIAGFRTPEACADSVRALLDWRAPSPVVEAEAGKAGSVLSGLRGAQLDEADGQRVLAALDIPFARSQVVASPEDRVELSFPVALKVLSADIPHKTEAGGVALGIPDAAALRGAVTRMADVVRSRRPDAATAGFLVQEMAAGLAEVIVGYRHDPEVGPIVMVGLGGVLAEIYADVAVALAPIDVDAAMELVASVRGLAPLGGYRGQPRGDLRALAQAVADLSRLAALPGRPVAEAEINPLIVRAEGEGVTAVDALVRLRARCGAEEASL